MPEIGSLDQSVADAQVGNWVDRYAPAAARPYLRLSRIDRPSPTWLLLIPCWWSILLASLHQQSFGWSEAWIMAGCAIGAVLMRGAGCTWNDITDRNYDGKVARTASRPIPMGAVTVRQAMIWMCVQALIAFAILLTFSPLAIALGIGSLAIVCIYPFAKRFTWWPQVFLGLAFNWGALLGWAAVQNDLHPAAGILYLAGIVWTLFYDTIYAHQDKEDDALIGIKSTARLFGDKTSKYLSGFMMVTITLLAVAVIFALVPHTNMLALVLSLGGVWAMGWHMAWQMRRLDINDADICLRLFRSNREAGLIPALFLAAALFA
ncbi:MAG: 4-hydroxybenzoate octaprenyltransferase [Pseudomonadota bacterium]